MSRRKRIGQLYADQLGENKLAVQEHLAKAFQVCCGHAKPDHHEACSNRVEPVVPDVVPGQESLL